MGVNGEALQLHTVYKKPYFLLQVKREFVSVLQITWESVSGTASHARCIWTCNEIEGLYDKIIITIAPSYTGINITRLLPLALLLVLHTRNNTDGNKLVIFSGIASYYGDNYILSPIGYSPYFVQSENKTIRNTIWRWVCRKNRYREHHSSCISRCIVKRQ